MPNEPPSRRRLCCNRHQSVPNHTQSAVDRRSTWYLSSNSFPSSGTRARVVCSSGICSPSWCSTRDRDECARHTHTHTHTHGHTDNTHTHTHTQASARADLCVFRGLHAAVRRDSVGPEIVSNFSMRAQREGKHTLGNGRSGSAPRAEGVGACTTRSDRVEFGASRTHCNGRPRFLCRQRKS